MAFEKMTVQQIKDSIENKLRTQFACETSDATPEQLYQALALVVRDEVMERRSYSRDARKNQQAKKVYYLCAEFLVGRALHNNMVSLVNEKNYMKALEELEELRQAAMAPEKPPIELEPWEDEVDFDTFAKSDFRVVKVKECEAVKKSKKLLRFTLDDGTGVDRQILSGIRMFYEPEDLVGKTLVAIVNLPPRKMMGLESCGMLLSAIHHENGEEKLNLLMLDDSIPAGAKLC